MLALVCSEWLDVVISALFSSVSSPEIPCVSPEAVFHTASVLVAQTKWGEKISQNLHPNVGLAMLASEGQTRNSKKRKDLLFASSQGHSPPCSVKPVSSRSGRISCKAETVGVKRDSRC